MEPQIPDIEKMRKRLLELILEYAFQYSETPDSSWRTAERASFTSTASESLSIRKDNT